MAISSSSGRSSSSGSSPWEALESGHTAWPDFAPAEQEQVVRHYAPKIKFLALRLKGKLPKSVELSELISAGTLGLVEALGKFQPKLGIKFDTYAENRIRGAMLDELRRLDWFPRSLRQKVRLLEEAINRFEHETGQRPSEEELQRATGLVQKDVRAGLEAMQSHLCISLDAIQETFAADGKEYLGGEPFYLAATQELMERVASLIEKLTPREKLVLSLYYSDELNMREVAEVMGVTEGRVSQLHSQALGRLRKQFHAQYGI